MRFDESRWPIVIVSLRGRLDKADYAQMMREGEALLARKEFHVLITDLRGFRTPADPAQRDELSDWASRMEAKYGKSRMASIKILSSRIVRAALVAFRWLSGDQREDVFVGTMDEALELAHEMCRKRGLDAATGTDE